MPQSLVYQPNLNSLYSYQWEHSSDGIDYTPIIGQTSRTLPFITGSSFTPTATTHYRMSISQTQNGQLCDVITESVSITISNPTSITINPINQIICERQPVSITVSGDPGYLFYVDDILQTNVTSNTLILNELTESVTITVEVMGFAEFYDIPITVNTIDPGEIIHNISCTSAGSLQFDSVSEGVINGAPVTQSVSGSYVWETSSDGSSWTTVTSQTSASYQIVNPTYPLYVRRNSLFTGLGCWESSNVISFTSAPVLIGGTVSPSQQWICSGTSPSQIDIVNGTEGNNVTYQWERSIDNGTTFFPIASQNSASLSLSNAILQNTQFRRITRWINDGSCPVTSNIAYVNILENQPGSITGGVVSVCYGDIPPIIDSQVPASVNSGTLGYQWEASTDGVEWENVIGQTSENLTLNTPLFVTHHFRRKSIQNTNETNCESTTNSFTVIVLENIQAGNITGTQMVCVGNMPTLPIVYTGDISPTLDYQWEASIDGINFTLIPNAVSSVLPIHNNVTFTPNQTTHYRMAISHGLDCIAYTNTATVDFEEPLILNYSGQSSVFCSEPTLSFTVSGSGTFRFYVDDILAQGPTSQTTFTISNPQNDITVTVIGESSGSCTSQQVSISLSYNALFPGEISGPEFVCTTDENFFLTSVNDGSVNDLPLTSTSFRYQWQSSLDGVTYSDILGAISAEFEYNIGVLTRDTHFRRLLVAGGCSMSSNSVLVRVTNSIPLPNSAQISTSVCNGAIVATYSNGNPPYTGELFDTNHNLIQSGTSDDIQTFTNLVPGQVYRLRVTDNSCFQPRELSIEVPLAISLDRNKVTLTNDLCHEQPSQIGTGSIRVAADAFTGGSNAFNYSWSGPNGYRATGSDLEGLVPGAYLLTVIDRELGCSQTESFIITGTTPLAATFLLENLTLDSNGNYQTDCQNTANSTLEVSATGGHGSYTYSWRKNGQIITANHSSKLENITAGSYEVTITDVPPTGLAATDSCQLSLSFNVLSASPLAVQIDRTAFSTSACLSPTINIPVTIAGGTPPYTLDLEGVGAVTTTDPNYTFTNIDPSNLNGSINLQVSDQGNCSTQLDPIPLEQGQEYSFTSSLTFIDCRAGTLGAIQLSILGTNPITEVLQLEWRGNTVHQFDTWTNGNGLLSNLNNPGSYTVTVTNSQGCVLHTQTFNVQDISTEKLAVKILSQKNTAGCDQSDGSIELELTGGYPPHTIQWEQLSDTNSWTILTEWNNHAQITGLTSGTYRAKVSDASSGSENENCSETITTRSIVLQEISLAIVQFSVDQAADLCSFDGTGQIRFQVRNDLTVSGTLTYVYSINNTAVDDSQINTTSGETLISGIPSGEHELTLTVRSDDFECSTSKLFQIEAATSPIRYTGPLTLEPSLCDELSFIEIQPSDISGGTPFDNGSPYALEWLYTPLNINGGTTSHTRYGWRIDNPPAGTYQLIIIDANGCKNDENAPITVTVEDHDIKPFSTIGVLGDDALKVIHAQCDNNNQGSIGIQINGGLLPFEVQWYAISPSLINSETQQLGKVELMQYRNQTVLTGLEPGVYRVEIQSVNESCENGDSNFTFHTETFEVRENAELHIVNGPYVENTICEGKPGRITLEVFDNNQGILSFFYNGSQVQKEEQEQINEQTYTLFIENPAEEGILTVLNDQGCSITEEINTALGTPEFSFSSPNFEVSQNILAREEITFKNNSLDPYVQSEWHFGDFSPPLILSRTATSSLVKYSYAVSGAYPVTLRIFNSHGCMREITHIVPVGKGYSVNTPNVFTPNNDGINDRFRSLVTGFLSVDFTIYDSRGNIIYSERVSEPDPENLQGLELQGWDGKNAPESDYFIYRVEGILFDNETTIEKTGTFILLK